MMPADPAPTPEEARVLREGLGVSSPGRIPRAIAEVEQQIVFEDLVILMVEGTQQAMCAFFDILTRAHVASAPESTAVAQSGEET